MKIKLSGAKKIRSTLRLIWYVGLGEFWIKAHYIWTQH